MKNSKKKLWISLAGIALSTTMLGATALAATDNLAGYNKFKELVIDTALNSGAKFTEASNSTLTSSFTLRKDQIEVATQSSVTKNHTEGDTLFSSTKSTIKSDFGEVTDEIWIENSSKKSSYISKYGISGNYSGYVSNYDNTSRKSYDYQDYSEEISITPAQERLISALIDMVAGDTKSHFRTNGNAISISLEGAQIPEFGQLALNVIEEEIRKSTITYHDEEEYYSDPDSDNILSIIEGDLGFDLRNMRLEAIKGDLEMTEDTFIRVNLEIAISGMDKNGVRHTLSFAGSVIQSDIGTTTADKIDLDDIEDTSEIRISDYSGTYSTPYSIDIDENTPITFDPADVTISES